MAEGKDDIEQTHCIIPKVYVFQVPKLSTSTGYKASDWSKTPIWSGQLRVVSKGDKCSILLEHTDKDGLFAACPVTNDKTVEPTTDSSRYFVLRMSDGTGRHAVIGIGFNDRTQAFDFKVSLQDWKNSNKDEGLIPSTPLEDLSIPQGGRIHVNLSGAAGKKKDKKPDDRERGASGSSTASLAEAVSSLKLAEPTKTKEKKKKKSVVNSSGAATQAQSGTASLFDFSGGASSSSSSDPFGSSSDPFATTAAASSSSSNDPFASMSSSTSTTSKPAKPVKEADPSDWVSF